MATDLLGIHLSPHPRLCINYGSNSNSHKFYFSHAYLHRQHSQLLRPLTGRKTPKLIVAKAVDVGAPIGYSPQAQNQRDETSLLLDVTGMMCGACMARVKSVLSSDERVDSVAVNMLTESAAVRLKREVLGGESAETVAESLARKLTECGFPSKRRVSRMGVAEDVRKWKEMAEKKEALLVRSRNRVAFAWTLVALCCGSHASHILHSLGIHVAHGLFWEVLHNSYVKGGLALGALLGPGRDLLLDGLMAFIKRSPNMNSLVGFGSVVAFIMSAVSLLNPELRWGASFFDEPVMLLGFVLLGRSLEEKARIKASSDMNELLDLGSKRIFGRGFERDKLYYFASLSSCFFL